MRRLIQVAVLVSALTLLFVAGCGSSSDDDPADTVTSDAASDTTPSSDTAPPSDTTAPGDASDSADVPSDTPIIGGSIAIYVAGDHTAKTFTDGLSGQTPRDYVIALSRYHVQTSLDAPSPALCFDHGDSFVEADMSGDTLVGTCATAALPSADYTYGRVKVEWARYTVDGVLHGMATPIPGPFTLFRAYSDTVYEGQAYSAGEGWVSFAGNRMPYSYDAFPVVPGVTTAVVDGEFTMVFPFTRPLPVAETDTDARWARFHWEVAEAFRWQERADTGYVDGTWDVALNATSSEQVSMAGVSGYFITTSLD